MPSEIPHRAVQIASEEYDFICSRMPVDVTTSYAGHLAIGLFSLAAEHLLTMLEGMQTGQRVGSALALARPMIEACYRLFWVMTLDDDGKVQEAIWKGTEKFHTLGPTLEKVEAYYSNAGFANVFNLIKPTIGTLNSLTHGGIEQIKARFDSRYNLDATYSSNVQAIALRTCLTALALAGIHVILFFQGAQNNPPDARAIADRIPRYILIQ